MVNIDTVYQRVLAFANKEQRGYITPQEFNLFAAQAQMEIFEQYFYDLNQYARINNSDEEYSDILYSLNEKVGIFENTSSISSNQVSATDFYKLGVVVSSGREVEEVQSDEILYMNQSYLTKPTTNRPVYVRSGEKGVTTYPSGITATANYIRKPVTPKWGYFVVGNKALHDTSLSKTTHFELHASEESELVYKILKFAGISMAKLDIMRAGQIQEQAQVQQEKQ